MKAIADRRHHRMAPVVLLMLALFVTGAVYAALSPSPAEAAAVSEDDVAAGQALFRANCATCHGTDAEGRGNAPSLVGVGAAAVDFQVSTGRMPMQATGPQAPSKPPVFDAEEVRRLAAYVASLAPGPAVPTDEQVDPALGDPANGMALFRTNCAMCHGAIGKGGALTQGKYAPSLASTSPRNVYQAMLTGPGSMPVFNDANLTPEDKRDVIAFLDQQHQGSPGGTDLGAVGPVVEGLWVWIVGMGALIGAAVWIGAKSA
ncbi:MAG: c-type cytochrome [Actinomycetales bacterium]|nr:c-type cytochrome [Actinomycetales bacterium]